FAVEDRVNTVSEPLRVTRLSGGRPCIFLRICSLRASGDRALRKLPVFNVSSFFALSDLPSTLFRLLECHPARVIRASGHGGREQMNSVSAAIGFTGDWIERHFESACRPRLLPWSRTLLQHFDDSLGNLLTMIALLRGTTAHSPLLPESRGDE